MVINKETVKAEIQRIEGEIARNTSLLSHLRGVLGALEGSGARTGRRGRPPGAVDGAPRARRRGRRIRRSSEELAARASEMVAFIKSQGKVSGQDLNRKFGQPRGITTLAFLQKHAPGAGVKTSGARSKMMYSVR